VALTLDSGFLAALQGGTTKLARLVTITRTDGTVYRYTDHDRDLVYSAQTYSATGFVAVSNISRSLRGEPQTADLDVVFFAGGITFADVSAGLFRKCTVRVDVVNWGNLAQTGPTIFYGQSSSIVVEGKQRATFSLAGRLNAVLNTLGEVYSPECRARLGDSRCGVDIESFKTTGTVKAVDNNRKFTVEFAVNPDNQYYALGEILWTSGNNNGLRMEVLDQYAVTSPDDQIILALNMPETVQVGDTFTMYAGCDQRPTTCTTKFNNKVNYRGEDFLSGPDKIRDVPRFEAAEESGGSAVNKTGYGRLVPGPILRGR